MANSNKVYLAVDLGASGGRVLAGIFDGSSFELYEVHRFSNGPFGLGSHLYWNVLELWRNIQDGLRKAAAQFGESIQSVGVDTWGVDFALLGKNDELLGNPYNYRDPQNQGMIEKASEVVSRVDIFAETGLQFMDFNSLFQLYAMKLADSSLLDSAQSFLMMPDLFHFLLTGEKANEFTDASTTQFLNPATRDWSRSLLDRLGIPNHFLQSIAEPGTRLGKVVNPIAESTGLKNVEVILPGTHDTASAVMAVPAEGEPSNQPNWAYISSGTWSLMGAEVAAPVVTDRCREFNFTNEGGVGGTIRLLKNITGLWLVQECRRIWLESGKEYSWSQLADMAKAASPLQSTIDPDDPSFTAPSNMPDAIRQFCRNTNQPVPESEGEVIRCALESLALKCRKVLEMLESLTGSAFETIHIVGGGTQNQLLCQMTADACNRRVVAGPVEATAIGNAMMQAIADGAIASVQEARQVIRSSFDVVQYEPSASDAWETAFQRLK